MTPAGGLDLCAGDLVRVRSKAEILRTLDKNARLEGLPFMPEMFEYAGQVLRVSKRAHKTCDFVTHTGIRKLGNTVHLEGLRCNGAAHGNCEAGCTFFWKEAWLERMPDGDRPAPAAALGKGSPNAGRAASAGGCTEKDVIAGTRGAGEKDDEPNPTYVCQATLLPQYTEPLSPWDLRQYVLDYRSGNVQSVWAMVPRFSYRMYDNLMNLGIGWGPILRWAYDQFRWLRGGRLYPDSAGTIPAGGKTPTLVLNLQPGELVRVKKHDAILQTLDVRCMNKGMIFSGEMLPYCGGSYRVRNRVNRLIDERTGKMLTMKSGGIILDDVVCQAKYNKGMIFCPRATFPYWREIWLERVDHS